MLRWVLGLGSALLLCGCFVLDELDAGEKIMDSHSPTRSAEAEAPAAPAADGEAAGPPTGQAWWSKSRSLGERVEAEPGDPKAPIRCRIAGGTRFMRRGDCLSQGGREA